MPAVKVNKKIKITFNNKKVIATLYPFPKKSVLEGVKEYNKFRGKNNLSPIDKVEDYKGIMLCNYKTNWWIYYGVDANGSENMTGHFDSRKRAIGWFTGAGR